MVASRRAFQSPAWRRVGDPLFSFSRLSIHSRRTRRCYIKDSRRTSEHPPYAVAQQALVEPVTKKKPFTDSLTCDRCAIRFSRDLAGSVKAAIPGRCR